MTTLDEIAPWPETAEDASAEALCRHFTVSAYAHDQILGSVPEPGTDKDEAEKYWSELGHVVDQFAIVKLLRFLEEFHKDVADDAAADIYDCMNDGGVVPELLRDWLDEYKIDPDKVAELAKADPAEKQSAA